MCYHKATEIQKLIFSMSINDIAMVVRDENHTEGVILPLLKHSELEQPTGVLLPYILHSIKVVIKTK